MFAMSQMEAIDSSIESSGYGSDALDNALKSLAKKPVLGELKKETTENEKKRSKTALF